MSRDQLQRSEELYQTAADLQAALWDAMSELEDAVGFEIDANRDLRETTLQALLDDSNAAGGQAAAEL